MAVQLQPLTKIDVHVKLTKTQKNSNYDSLLCQLKIKLRT